MAKLHLYSKTERMFIRLVGTRGSLLIIIGAIWIILGASYLNSPMEWFSKPGSGGVLDFLDNGPGEVIFASLWVLGGVLAIYSAIRRPKICEDSLGFNGLLIPPLLWSFGYWWSFGVNLFSHGVYGRDHTHFGGLLYGAVSVMVLFLSRHLQDHPDGPCFRRHSIGNVE